MTTISYQSYDNATGQVGGATLSVDGEVTLERAQTMATEDAGEGMAVDVLAVVQPDGSDLVAELEDRWAAAERGDWVEDDADEL